MSLSFIYPSSLWLLLLLPLTALLALAGPRRPTIPRFWTGLVLRLLLLCLVVLALSGIQVRLQSNTQTLVFLLDVSDSIPGDQRTYGEAFIKEVLKDIKEQQENLLGSADYRAAVVMFGQDALVERLASADTSFPGFTSVPLSARTDIASALQLGLALFPNEGAKRMVLLSDGRENLGTAIEQVELLAANGIQLVYVPLSGPMGEVEVLVESLVAPSEIRQGQSGQLEVLVQSSAPVQAILRVFDANEVIFEQETGLQRGQNRFLVPVEAAEVGFRRFRAQVIPAADTRLQNNEASAFTVIYGPPRVLVVEGTPGEGSLLAEALRSSQMQVDLVPPGQLPTTLNELENYAGVVLVNVPALLLPATAMEQLPIYVRDLGHGLLMVGGNQGFGAGGYLRTPIEEALPVYMDVRSKEQTDRLALVLTIDKSGSMGRCHCDNPDLNQTYTRVEVGQPKVDIAKAAVTSAAAALGRQDYLGVVAFDDRASWAFQLNPLADFVSLERAIGGITASGQTNLRAGVEAAFEALKNVEARRKHIILLTDGWSYSGDISALVDEMTEAGITFSIVAAGQGSAEFLKALAERGTGTYYPAEDILRVPEFFLKETIKAVGEYIIEEPFYPLPSLPGPVLKGLNLETLPPLLGYNGTTPKNTARLDLVTSRGDPLLATWQYGVGRSAAWTSDLKGQWALTWVNWEEFATFASQLVDWTLPAPRVEGVSASARMVNDQGVISVEVLDQAGLPLNFLKATAILVGPDLEPREVRLPQVGAGKYQAALDLDKPGTYLVRVGLTGQDDQPLAQQTLGLVVPYSPEYRESGLDLPRLMQLAAATRGGEARLPTIENSQPGDNRINVLDFAGLAATFAVREIWRPLLLVVALLFPLDVAIRRVRFSREDYAKAWAWVIERVPLPRRAAAQRQRGMGQLFQARERARLSRQRIASPPGSRQVVTPPPEHSPQGSDLPRPQPPGQAPAPGESPRPSSPAPAPQAGEDTLARLRKAKKRARGDE